MIADTKQWFKVLDVLVLMGQSPRMGPERIDLPLRRWDSPPRMKVFWPLRSASDVVKKKRMNDSRALLKIKMHV